MNIRYQKGHIDIFFNTGHFKIGFDFTRIDFFQFSIFFRSWIGFQFCLFNFFIILLKERRER